jgi:hypothetical protein
MGNVANLALGVELGDLGSAVACDEVTLVCLELASMELGTGQGVRLAGVSYK